MFKPFYLTSLNNFTFGVGATLTTVNLFLIPGFIFQLNFLVLNFVTFELLHKHNAPHLYINIFLEFLKDRT